MGVLQATKRVSFFGNIDALQAEDQGSRPTQLFEQTRNRGRLGGLEGAKWKRRGKGQDCKIKGGKRY